jgi:hypothetical protein
MPKTIPLTRGQVAIVDDEDYERVSAFNWHYIPKSSTSDPNDGYARRAVPATSGNRRQRLIPMQGMIIDCPKHLRIDHINGNGLDNRKENLRICTHAENGRNRKVNKGKKQSIYKGVTRNGNKFKAAIVINWKKIYLGNYDTEEEAANAYDQAAMHHFGKFACLNFPQEQNHAN